MMKAYLTLFFLAFVTCFTLEGMDNSKANELLFAGAREGNIAKVRRALKNHANVNSIDIRLASPLYYAAEGGHNRIIKLLMENGASIAMPNTAVGFQAIHVATSSGHLSTVQLLVSYGASPTARNFNGEEPIHWAATRGRLIIAQWLVEQGASVRAQDNDHIEPIQLAAHEGQQEVVEWLISKGADVNAVTGQSYTALLDALLADHPGLAQWLIEHGADVNVVSNEGATPLGLARGKKYDNVVALILGRIDPEVLQLMELSDALSAEDMSKMASLLDGGADVNACDRRGNSVLHFAVTENRQEAVSFLIRHGANLNLKNGKGYAPLHVAASCGYNPILLELLEHGASVHTLRDSACDALRLAAFSNHRSSLKVLLEWGGAINAPQSNLVDSALESGHFTLAEWLLWHGGQFSEQNKKEDFLRWLVSKKKFILYKIVRGTPDEARDMLIKKYDEKALSKNELNRALLLAVAFEQEELVRAIVDNCRDSLTVQGLENALISAATRGNWCIFQEIYSLARQVVSPENLSRFLRTSFSWAATHRDDVGFLQELYRLMHTILPRADFVSALEDALARSAVQGHEYSVSFILEQAFANGHAEDMSIARARRRVALSMNHPDTPQERRVVLERIYDSLNVIPRVRLVNRQGNTSPIHFVADLIRSHSPLQPEHVPAGEIAALILRLAFQPAFNRPDSH